MSTLAVDKATNVAGTQYYNLMLLGTSKSATDTSVDFAGIPSGVKRITVMLYGVSTSGTSNLLLQIGAGSILTTGYISNVRASSATSGATNGVLVTGNNAATYTQFGILTITTLGSNLWVESGNVAPNTANGNSTSAGQVTLGGTLDRIRITTVNGTDTFDAGSISLLYEGYEG